VATIKLEFNEDDLIAQQYLGEALVNMAKARGYVETVTHSEASTAQQVGRSELLTHGVDEQSVDIKGFEEVLAKADQTVTDEPQLPWDERIHSGNKTQNADGSWKKRKKPKDMSADQWAEFIKQVEAELTTLMSIPVETPSSDYPLYWRYNGSDEVGIIRNDEEYEQITNGGHGEIIDLISEELFNELRVDTIETEFKDEQPVVDTPKSPADAKNVETQQADVTASQPDITPPPPPVVDTPKLEQDDQTPPPPAPNPAHVGSTQVGVEVVNFVGLVKMLSAKCAGDSTKSATIKDMVKAKYDVEFTALAKRPELIPQVAEFLNSVEV